VQIAIMHLWPHGKSKSARAEKKAATPCNPIANRVQKSKKDCDLLVFFSSASLPKPTQSSLQPKYKSLESLENCLSFSQLHSFPNPTNLLCNQISKVSKSLRIACLFISSRRKIFLQLGVLFDSSCATAAQAATVEHESDRP
jgi:hypothetical protein